MKCNECNNPATNLIKTMVMTCSWSSKPSRLLSRDDYIDFVRREMIEIVKEDVIEGKNKGEIFYCDNCFKQRNKKPWIGEFEK